MKYSVSIELGHEEQSTIGSKVSQYNEQTVYAVK